MSAVKPIDDLVCVYDDGGKTCERYTVCFLETSFVQRATGRKAYVFVGMSQNPFHPQGIGQHGECEIGRHLGKRIRFADLPEDCKRLVLMDLADTHSN